MFRSRRFKKEKTPKDIMEEICRQEKIKEQEAFLKELEERAKYGGMTIQKRIEERGRLEHEYHSREAEVQSLMVRKEIIEQLCKDFEPKKEDFIQKGYDQGYAKGLIAGMAHCIELMKSLPTGVAPSITIGK